MAGSVSEDSGVGRSSEVISSNQRCQSTDSLAEWRSCEQVENGTPSTSPPYWDTDDDDDCGAKPSDLYGKFTWKIENFSQISKRELRSNAFEVGGYKWYILVYPQGCDVCNHLSLFLCVANHDKLLPGWSHFAQFTIAVVNKDPKKSKYSDTLHRFWKKEHDWGWKKFMELSKVFDGFIVSDTLVIKAQVQVIREKAHRPFRCLDCLYRRELVRVYLTNVEGICRRFVEERRGKLTKLIEDEMRWSSFRAFWLGVDQNARRRMSREETDAILKVVVKHFFIEKEVTSTLVMDSLYSGLKALECQTRNKKGRAKISELDEAPAPVVRVEKDMFVLADDVLLLLERIAREPLPPSKDDKGPQNRTKDGSSGEDFNKDSIERDERRLTELGRRTVEIFVLAHIFSNRIEVAYQEAVALKRQEELIREEEAAGQAESELKAKRGTAEKEKRTKKKQAKQKRSSRKGKERGRDEKSDASIQEKHPQESPSGESTLEDFSTKQTRSALEKADVVEDVSVGSDTGDDVAETRPDVEERDGRPVNWDTDTLEMHLATEACTSEPIQNGQTEKKNCTSVMDDSSSTCSTDSVPSVVRHSPYKGNSLPNYKCKMSPNRGKNQRVKGKHGQSGWAQDTDNQPLDAGTDTSHARDDSSSCQDNGPEPEAVVLSLKDRIQWLEQHLVEKEEEVVSLQRKLSVKDPVNLNRLPKQKAAEAPSSPNSPTSSLSPSRSQPKQTTETTGPAMEPVPARETSSNSPSPSDKTAPLIRLSPQLPATSKLEPQKPATLSKPASIPTERPVNAHQLSALSRPSSAPLIPDPRPTAPAVSVVQTSPLLARSFSAAGRLGTDPSPATSSLSHCLPVAQSYRNAIMGKAVVTGSAGFTPCLSSANLSPTYSQATSSPLPSSVLLAQSPMAKDQSTGSTSGSGSGFTFGTVTPEILHNPNPWMDDSYLLSEIRGLDLYGGASRPLMHFTDEVSSATSSWQTQGVLPDEFPHLDIINYLLDEEHSIGKAAAVSAILQHPGSGPHLNRQFTFPGDMGMVDMVGPSFNCCRFDRSAKYNEEGIRNVYGSSGAPSFDRPRENHQSGLSAYTLSSDGQVDGMAHSQWPLGPTDLSLLSTRNAETDGYPYQMLDYSNIGCSLNSYGVFRPSNGH